MSITVLCKTCAAMNAYEGYSMPFIKAAYEYIGNTITVTAFTFVLGIGVLFLAFNAAFKNFDPFSLIKRLFVVVLISSIITEGSLAPMAYEALLEWGLEAAHGLLAMGSDYQVIVPSNANTEAAKLIGTAEAYLWDFMLFAGNVIEFPNIFETGMGAVGDYVISIVFGFIIFAVYGVIILYFTYMVLRSLIYLQVCLAFSSLILAAAAFPQTRSVFVTGLNLMINAALTFVGAGFAMGITAKILSGSRTMIACFSREAGTEGCKSELIQLSNMMGVDNVTMQNALQSYEVFALFTILGFFCLFIHYLVVKFTNMLTGTPDDSNALMGFTAATKGALLLGAGAAFSGMQKGARGVAKGAGPTYRGAVVGGKYAARGAVAAGKLGKSLYESIRKKNE